MGGWSQYTCPCCGRWANARNFNGDHRVGCVDVTSHGKRGLQRDIRSITFEERNWLLEMLENARQKLIAMRGLRSETGFEPIETDAPDDLNDYPR